MSKVTVTLPELLNPQQCADIRGTTTAVLQQERHLGRGPKYIRDGRRIRYRLNDLIEYLDANTVAP